MNFVSNISRLGFVFLLLFSRSVLADDKSFADSMARADAALKQGNFQGAANIYAAAESAQAGNASNLCVLAHRYCDITYLTNAVPFRKELLAHATACSQRAVNDEPRNATAHASLAVCYAKSCKFADIKTELADSKLFKIEAEKTIALDPTQDIAYYLLGRWNYGIASAGILARAYVKVVYGGLPHASYEDAIADFKKACDLAPNRILNHAGLAMAYEAMGKKKLEIVELERCCALKPMGPEDMDAVRDARAKLVALLR